MPRTTQQLSKAKQAAMTLAQAQADRLVKAMKGYDILSNTSAVATYIKSNCPHYPRAVVTTEYQPTLDVHTVYAIKLSNYTIHKAYDYWLTWQRVCNILFSDSDVVEALVFLRGHLKSGYRLRHRIKQCDDIIYCLDQSEANTLAEDVAQLLIDKRVE